ncbi:phosphoenolpyruvate synthase [Patescibacteria group bacterium]
MQLIKWFKDTSKFDIAEVGGKGANLGELFQAGLPVPNGFTTTADAYFDYLKSTKIDIQIQKLLNDLNPEDSKDLQARAEKIQKLILNTPLPEALKKEIISAYHKLAEETKTPIESLYVAVRSSATAEDLAGASFAGQQSTFLNVLGDNDLLEAVLKCWASLFEARAIYYREDKKFEHLKVGIAVPIQKMVNSESAGVMFTIDPTNNDMDHIFIEAAYGLGEVVVLGAVTPDRYLVNKKTLKITNKDIHKQTWKLTRESGAGDTGELDDLEKDGVSVKQTLQEKQKISDENIIKLANLGLEIEKHYNAPQDTEWAIEEGEVYMVQSRPVTTLEKSEKSKQASEQEVNKEKTIILKGAAASTGIASGPVKIIHSPDEIDKIEKGDVLVTEMTTPDYVPAMKRSSGIVTDKGGRTCHAAIVSRELGIPCVVGTTTATKDLKTGQVISVDGAKGVVYDGKVFSKVESTEHTKDENPHSIAYQYKMPVTATKIYVNLAEPELAPDVAKRAVDGVGLLRAEFIIAGMGKHPRALIDEGKSDEFVDNLASGLEKFARAFHPRPVVYRATDFKTNEYKNLKGGDKYEQEEENPMIGYRGCMRYIQEPDLFALELQAIQKIHDMDLNNLQLMIPFVRTVQDLQQVLKLVDNFGLRKDKDFKVLMMAEVPSNVVLIDEFLACEVDGISIGSNDLTQLILGADRDNAKLIDEFDERDPAVMQSMAKLIRKTREAKKTVSICGQAPSNFPEVVKLFIENGATSISVNPDVIEKTRLLVASIEKRILLDKEIQK